MIGGMLVVCAKFHQDRSKNEEKICQRQSHYMSMYMIIIIVLIFKNKKKKNKNNLFNVVGYKQKH